MDIFVRYRHCQGFPFQPLSVARLTGLSNAIGEKVRDERMKANLITNVSHDLKTPLTSIINYVGLLRRENIQNPNASAYIEVLNQKALRLKQLMEVHVPADADQIRVILPHKPGLHDRRRIAG